MFKQRILFHQLSLVGFLCWLSLSLATAEPSHADLKDINRKIDAQNTLIKDKQRKQQRQKSSLKNTEKAIALASRKIYDLKKEIQEEQEQLITLQKEQGVLSKQRLTQEKIISEQINISYRSGREKKIKMLLNQEDSSQLSRLIIYSDYFNQARLDTIKDYQRTMERLEQVKPSIEKKTRLLLKNKDQLVAEQRSLKKQFSQRSDVLAQMNKDIYSEKGKLKQLKEDQKQLEKLLKEVEVAVNKIQLPSDSTPFKQMKRKLPWPVTGSYEKRFGKKHTGALRWEGDAFYAPLGKEIKAIHHGRVVFADWFRGKGFLLIIDHGSNYMSLYAHNQSLLRDTGDWVSQGETIATLGNTGGLDHAELYFEIRHEGKPQNPKKWLKKR